MRTLLPLLLLSGCATLSGARPLEPGVHEVGATLGGPFVSAFGAVIPIPNVIVQGRSGLALLGDRPLDLGYGMNLTGLPFGAISLHASGSFLLAHQTGGLPAVSVTNRFFFATNPVDPGTVPFARGVLAVNQIEFSASWLLGNQLLYAALSESIDLQNTGLLLTPVLGATFNFKQEGPFRLHAELRYWGVNRTPQTDRVAWLTPGPGALGVNLGFSWLLGGGQ